MCAGLADDIYRALKVVVLLSEGVSFEET